MEYLNPTVIILPSPGIPHIAGIWSLSGIEGRVLPLVVKIGVAILIWTCLLYLGAYLLDHSKIPPCSIKSRLAEKVLLVVTGFAAWVITYRWM